MIDEVVMEVLSSCSCCLIRRPDRNLKKPYTHQNRTEIYSDMLEECFDIHLDVVNDESGICEVCAGRLRDASDFKLQVQHSQVELQARVRRALKVLSEKSEPDVKSEIADDDGLDSLSVEVPPVEMADNGGTSRDFMAYEPEVKIEIADDDATDNSPDCAAPGSREMSHAAASDEDRMSRDAPALPGGSVSARARQQLAMTCSVRLERLQGDKAPHQYQICHKSFDHESSLTTHIKEMHHDSTGVQAEEEAYTCDACGERFKRKRSLIHHVQKHETATARRKRYCCDICNKSFTTNGTLNRHIRIHTGRKPYSCEICNKSFTQQGHLKVHKRIHARQQPYSCEICNKSFTHQRSLIMHKIMHTGQKPYTCEICNKSFTRQGYLKVHKRIHTGQKPYICKICNKSFTDHSALRRHIMIHTGQKPYSCEICNKSFAHQGHLKVHKRIHTGQKPYTCEICNKSFTHQQSLKMHKIIHTGQKPYTCEICNKSFTQQGSLNKHIRIHTGQRPYSCEICNKSFTRRDNLKMHKLIHQNRNHNVKYVTNHSHNKDP